MPMLNLFEPDRADVRSIIPARTVTHEEVARRAFEIYCERACHDGYDLDDWLRAERECTEALVPVVLVRLRIKADRRREGGTPPLFERRRRPGTT